MPLRRVACAFLVVGALCGGLWLRPPAARAAGAGLWTPVPPLPFAQPATATLLPDGTVLVAGGEAGGEVARYDPVAGRWRPTARPLVPQAFPAAVALRDGRVLLIGGVVYTTCPGGYTCPVTTPATEVYDPAADRWTRVADLRAARSTPEAVVLKDGRVLVLGGSSGGRLVAGAEIYDPAADRWAPAAPPPAPLLAPTLAPLADGRVLAVGGYASSAQPGPRPITAAAALYDPAADRWAPAAPLLTPRRGATATPLADGQVLVVGGANEGGALASAEVYDPTGNRWTATGPLHDPREGHAATRLRDGRVLVEGGAAGGATSGYLASAEIYDPATNAWAVAASMNVGRSGPATLLRDGRVLATGGDLYPAPGFAGRTAEVYDPAGVAPAAPRRCFLETGHCAQGRFLAYWEQHGGLAVNGYPLSDEFQQQLEDRKTYTVQYFERVRLEYHPEFTGTPYEVELGQFGRHILQERTGQSIAPPAQPKDGFAFFQVTGHNVAPDFFQYWQANGGLAQFGYPLTEEFQEQLEDGKAYTVQYFERARFERHPENAAPYDIELGQFGRQILAENGH